MYGFAKGVGPSRDVAGSAQDAMKDEGPRFSEIDWRGPMFSGINGQGNSLTMDGPATNPMGVNDIESKKLKMAMLMAGRGMTGFGLGMRSGSVMPPGMQMQQAPQLDMYGNPVG